MDPILPILSILGYWFIILGFFGGPGNGFLYRTLCTLGSLVRARFLPQHPEPSVQSRFLQLEVKGPSVVGQLWLRVYSSYLHRPPGLPRVGFITGFGWELAVFLRALYLKPLLTDIPETSSKSTAIRNFRPSICESC